SSNNIYRYNEFFNTIGGIGLRDGDSNQIYGNSWSDEENTANPNRRQDVSIAIKGQYNLIANNVFNVPRARGAISENRWGTRKFRSGTNTTSRTGYNLIANNTIIATRPGTPAISVGRNGGEFDVTGGSARPIIGSVYINNIIMGGAKLFGYQDSFVDPQSGQTRFNDVIIENNLFYPTENATLGEGFSVGQNSQGNPQLGSDYRPTTNSSRVIDKGNSVVLNIRQDTRSKFKNVNVAIDIDVDYLGAKRRVGSSPDIGAIEFVGEGENLAD
ncbi:MAG: hypothetical protein L3J84_08790, partial [Gammaproteobacteria bacterium]|nr:hypothetical protein [Gammaproteobacteria bacterium]